jgi:hypothetical protein
MKAMTAEASTPALPRPGPIGRIVRLVLGLGLVWLVYDHLFGFHWTFESDHIDAVGLIFIALVSLYLIPYLGMVLGRGKWSNRSRWTLLGGYAALGAWSWFRTGDFQGPILDVPALAVELVLLGLLGISFVLAAVLAVPG